MHHKKRFRRDTRSELKAGLEVSEYFASLGEDVTPTPQDDEPAAVRPKRVEETLPNGRPVVLEWTPDALTVEYGAGPKLELKAADLTPDQVIDQGPVRVTYRPTIGVSCPALDDESEGEGDGDGLYHPTWMVEMHPTRPRSPAWDFVLFDGTLYMPFKDENFERLRDVVAVFADGDEADVAEAALS